MNQTENNMEHTHKNLLDWLEIQMFGGAAPADVIEQAPGLTLLDAYRLRDALMHRRVAKGDRHIGYKVGGASRTMQAQEHVEGPMIGCLMASGLYAEDRPIRIGEYAKVSMEAEVGVLLKSGLAGPGVDAAQALLAVECIFPAIEVVAHRSTASRSHQMRIIGSKFTGGIVIGTPPRSPHGIDLRLEGMVLTLNEEVQGSATGVEVLGNPLNALALVANTIAEYGARLEAGMLIMTGSFLGNLRVKHGDRVRASYTRLGSVSARFVP